MKGIVAYEQWCFSFMCFDLERKSELLAVVITEPIKEKRMNKYKNLWEYVKNLEVDEIVLSFNEIEQIAGIPLDHSFLNEKKELMEYDWAVAKISMKNKTVLFVREGVHTMGEAKKGGESSQQEYIQLTAENIMEEHLCCIIRTQKTHPGIEAKRAWLSERVKEGHIFRKLNVKGCVFIEYAPLESAWVPIVGENFYYIYCLWVQGEPRGHGYGKQLLEYCINDAKVHGRSGICMLGANKQKAWLSDQSFAKKYGFETVDSTIDGYELLALSFDGTTPRFAPNVKQTIEEKGLKIYYDYQCPYILQRIEKLRAYCEENGIPFDFICVDSLEKAKQLPCVFNNWAVFYNGNFVTVNQLDEKAVEKLIKRQ